MPGSVAKDTNTLSWFVVVVAGVVVLAVVWGLSLFSRMDAGQDVLDGARPAFTEERVAGDLVAIAFVDNIVNTYDPIIDVEGGAAGEVGALVDLVASVTDLEPADVLVALESNFPHTFHLLLTLPLDAVSAEIPDLLDFVAENSDLADGNAVLTAISETTPRIAQALVNLGVVTDGWRDVPGTEDLTRFDGSDVSSFPEVRDYLVDDLVPAVRAVAQDYRELDTTAPPVDVFPPLLMVVGILVIAYGLAMLTITRVTAPPFVSPSRPSADNKSNDAQTEEPELVDLAGVGPST